MVLSFWSGCTTEEIYQAAQIKGIFRLKSPSAMNGKLIIEEAYLKLSHIDAIGNRHGENTNLTHPISLEEPPYQLSRFDSSQVSFNLPSRSYDQLDFHLFLFQDTYQLIVKEEGNGDVDEPNEEGDEEEDGDKDDEEDRDSGQDDDKDNEDHDDADNKDDDKDKGDHDDDNDDDDDDDDNDDEDNEDDDGRMSDNKKNRTVDIDHFFQNAKPAMVIIGTYQNNAKILKVIFAVDGIEKFTLAGKQNSTSTIILNKQNTAEITFNPQHWFESITPADLESASIQTYREQQVVFIHKDFNTHLFEALAPRIEESADLNFTALPDESGF